MFWFEKTIYTDILQEWRNVKIWDFNLFDRVIIWNIKTPFVIIWEEEIRIHLSIYGIWWHPIIKKWDPSEYRWWKLYDAWEEFESMKYLEYKCINSKWEIKTAYKIQKYYWEFQKEFTALEQAKKDEEELENKIKEISLLKESMMKNYDIAREIAWKNYIELWIK